MARKKQSGAEDVINITSRLPWWVGVILAASSYVWLHSVTIKGLPQAAGGNLSTTMIGSLFFAFASFGQYILPFLFGFGALLSIIMSVKRKKLHHDVSSGDLTVADISWQEFEILIGEHFRRQGFAVHETKHGPDGGVDLVLKKDSGKYLVQCKHWKAQKVGVKIVRELLGVMVGAGAAGGYVVTSGQFTRNAVTFARDNNIQLLDGKDLRRIIKALPKPSSRPSSNNSVSKTTRPLFFPKEKTEVCSKCGSPMVVRVAKKGSRAGQKFLGCSSYPSCRFTMPLN